MEEPISKTALDRLPSVIKGLGQTYQKVYISLRLRKSDAEIARRLALSLEDTRDKIDTVRHELIKAGQLSLIEDPLFVSIHSDDSDIPDIQIAAAEIGIAEQLMLKEFITILTDSVNSLPSHQAQLLKLRYRNQLSAKDIAGFCNCVGLRLVPDKSATELKEQDIFYALNNALKEVLSRLKMRYKEEASFGMDNLKYIFEEIGA